MLLSPSRLQAALAALWPGFAVSPLEVTLDDPVRLVVDSRRVAAGAVFVAVPGVASDGRAFIPAALAAGAALVLAHDEGPRTVDDARVCWLPALRERLGELGHRAFAVSEGLELIGVTGTNGKSSVTHYIAALSQALGRDAGMVGTLGHGRPGALHPGELTTPGPLALQASLGALANEGITRVAMEVSSHALEQGRLDGCRLQAAVFTNLSRDHLDYHGSMAAYAAAKARLFRRPELDLAVVNADDPLARLMLAGLTADVRVLAVGEGEAVTLRVVDWVPHAEGQRALVATPEGERVLELPLMGRFNLTNVLLAMATLYGLGADLEALFVAAAKLAPVPGRMQALAAGAGPTVVIDYAHTPDALENALVALKAHRSGSGRLWCLFGCGGDRDRGKRPLMAAVAERHADCLVVTDDNPRGEAPAAIREQILAGLSEAARASAVDAEGRARAIHEAIREAKADDIILIAGKGHETYQEIDGRRHPFSDRAEAEAALAARATGSAP
ncbi:UDP-N-acetylmuramoyl-L-alanyl-D-glutamate--2,6-diaminopimelate ligase [Halomonas cerina]|uniref:UDP-N-acetylmuramoyl-L-alanyl-D-glutamate--2,6-diaminopimelate ligase n=1 Tax=Halomonas cerina TaxID=447424 RepID=A0A839VCD0_9GAMM|nr:UDP-N-acetylmuramoyl-L-alanyl-D-glutamate--2,6-diaminopimelate ligase [Halomonas cerina]MBB3191610.1 UDP-N-acetylmuramoyl-L-alanyl-D-glutamate--2,6-diaminopimelate ligase [Halomonas cerina]